MSLVGVFNNIETPQDAAAEVIRVNNANPDIQGWAMIGGWPLFTSTLLTELNPAKMKVASVDALPAQLEYVEKGVVPVLLAQSVYLWGDVGVRTIVDKLYFKKDVPQMIPMELVKVTKENLNSWAKQLKDWGFTDVNPKFLKYVSRQSTRWSSRAEAGTYPPRDHGNIADTAWQYCLGSRCGQVPASALQRARA